MIIMNRKVMIELMIVLAISIIYINLYVYEVRQLTKFNNYLMKKNR
jgi:cell division protein FtsL